MEDHNTLYKIEVNPKLDLVILIWGGKEILSLQGSVAHGLGVDLINAAYDCQNKIYCEYVRGDR